MHKFKLFCSLAVIAILLLTACNRSKQPAPTDQDTVAVDSNTNAIDERHPEHAIPASSPQPSLATPTPEIESHVEAVQPSAPENRAMADDREELRRRSRDANSKTNRKPELTQHIEQLDEKAQTVMARIDVHYSHLQQARSQNDATVNDIMMLLTNDFIELIDIKNEQIGLAIQAGKDKLVQEYQEQLDQINKEKDQMLSGQH